MEQSIVVVTGLPRSGTSLMMRMLEQGGMSVLVDEQRPADEDNPLGYYEYGPARALQADASWLLGAEGRAVKLVSLLVGELPKGPRYQVLLMRRALGEVLASQRKMLLRLGQAWRAEDDDRLGALYERQLGRLEASLALREDIDVMDVHYHRLVREAEGEVSRVVGFLGRRLNQDLMIRAVDVRLYRNIQGGG